MSKPRWIRRWNTWIAPRPVRPGVFRRKEGGYVVRGRTKDPRTGKRREVRLVLADVDEPNAALVLLHEELRKVREGVVDEESEPISFAAYAVWLLEEKVRMGEIRSAKTRESWGSVLELHLIPAFGDLLMDRLRRADVKTWMREVAGMIKAGQCKPGTANSRLKILKVVINTYWEEHELEGNPVAGIKNFDTSLEPTYTEEQPNSLTAEEVPRFLAMMRQAWPQHFAMVALGFATGLRPSSMRPIRRRGATPDVLWDEGALLVRRSHTRWQEVMESTKTGLRQKLLLPEELMEILRWHVDRLPDGPRLESDLLFPSRTGGYQSESVLQKPFADVTARLKLAKRVTPRAMRRTFQDLARAAEVKDIVTRSISGHATAQMQRHYSTVAPAEVLEGIGKVVSLAQFKAVQQGQVRVEQDENPGQGADRGMHRGMHGPRKGKTASQASPN